MIDLLYPPVKATSCQIEYLWSNKDLKKLAAEIAPLRVIGTLHSHPGYEPHISKTDMLSFGELGEAVLGIYSYWMPSPEAARIKTDLTFYTSISTVKAQLI